MPDSGKAMLKDRLCGLIPGFGSRRHATLLNRLSDSTSDGLLTLRCMMVDKVEKICKINSLIIFKTL
jgi:hypothetical protein